MSLAPATAATVPAKAAAAAPIRVMVVDDSAIIRGLITKMLEGEQGIVVAASCGNGLAALQALGRVEVDVVVLDIEMPVMDGMTALPQILKLDPKLSVVIASTLSQRNAEISLQALALGAVDYIPKPSTSGINGSETFKRELIEKVRTFGLRTRTTRARMGGLVAMPVRTAAAPSVVPSAAPAPPRSAKPIGLRQPSSYRPQVLCIGSSTGGPQALNELLRGIKPSLGVPILITQHMPPTFTSILAQHISKASGWPCHEAIAGEAILPGTIYVAPGDHHMLVERRGTTVVAKITQDPPENFCRPAVDPMLRSVAKAYGARVMTVILTGMGSDGMRGGQEIVAVGGSVVAQDEESSVVWGMPGAATGAGICSAVLPLSKLAAHVVDAFTRGMP